MKRVPLLAEEPPELGRWRAENPEDDASGGVESRGTWQRFKDSGFYGPLVDRLLAQQQGLCGYCEQRLSQGDGSLVAKDYQVEHVLAKSGGAGRGLDWRNVMLCCEGGTWAYHKDPSRYMPSSRGAKNVSCGQAKGDADIEGPCDPRSLPWHEPVVRVDIDGRLRPNEDACRSKGIEPEMFARVLDDVLALNCARLRVARRKAIEYLDNWLKKLHEEIQASSHLPAGKLAQAYQLFVEGRLCPDRNGHLRKFWTTERLYLGETAEAWIHDNAALLHFGE